MNETVEFVKNINGHTMTMQMRTIQDQPLDLEVSCESCDEYVGKFDMVINSYDLAMEEAFTSAEEHAR